MSNYLSQLIEDKQQEVLDLHATLANDKDHPVHQVTKNPNSNRIFYQALQGSSYLNVIAEIKRKSPSKAALAEIKDPVALARQYVIGGAKAISVLTDQKGFAGSLDDLRAVKAALPNVPVLRKDFIIDSVQIKESVAAGADAILLIVAVLGSKLGALFQEARSYGLDVLVEVHTKEELDIALDVGADIIGINNRNLDTFEVDIKNSLDLVMSIPEGIVTVAESGISDLNIVRRLQQAGFDAVLIGEALVTADDPIAWIQSCLHPQTCICGIKDTETARAVIELGADFISIMHYTKSTRHVELNTIRDIVQTVLVAGKLPIVVVVDLDAKQINHLLEKTGAPIIQLHGDISRAACLDLPENVRRVFVVPVREDGNFEMRYDAIIQKLNPERDILLFDSEKGGSGRAFDWGNFSNPYPFPFILAGGLSPENVNSAIRLLKPSIVDVSSGVENSSGEKDMSLVMKFIYAVREGQ